MHTINVMTRWSVFTPTVYRYMDAEHVDQFFTDGSLRLSSFVKFHKHADEQRLDADEGKSAFLHRTAEQGGQTILADLIHGHNAWILCTTMRHTPELQRSFGASSYVRINEPTEFALRICRHITVLLEGGEGPCLYQDHRFIERDLGHIDVNWVTDPSVTEEERHKKMHRLANDEMGHRAFFLKHSSFGHQSEYRFVWLVSAPVGDYLDIKVPEVRELCSRPSDLDGGALRQISTPKDPPGTR